MYKEYLFSSYKNRAEAIKFTDTVLYMSACHPLWISGYTLPLQKLEWLFYLILKTARSYLHLSGQNT